MNKNYLQISKELKKKILQMAFEGGSSSAHIGGALSITDVMAVLIGNEQFTKKKDQLILSKGHSCLAYYAVLMQIGKISEELISAFEKDGSPLMGHPIKNLALNINFSTGSLGMGLSLGVGSCIANKKLNNNINTIVILGDGECNEGSVWEAAMSASHYNLDNLVAVVDNNGFQQTGSTNFILKNENLFEKFKSFNWDVAEIDGHNFDEIEKVLNVNSKKPKAIIAKTIKGKGVSFIENNNSWHHKILSKINLENALKELK
jgi:transketolase